MVSIYAVLNKINGKLYIGKTSATLRERWNSHKAAARRGSVVHFHNAIRKYPSDAWDMWEIDNAADQAAASVLERRWISILRPFHTGYNSTPGGEGTSGIPVKPETRLKLSIINNGRIVTAEARKKIGDGNRGKVRSAEYLRAISALRKGKKSTPQAIAARSEGLRGHVVSEETRRKIGDAQRGKPRKMRGEIHPLFRHEIPTEDIINLRLAGCTLVQIADKFNTSHTMIRDRIKMYKSQIAS